MTVRKWLRRLAVLGLGLVLAFFFIVLPVLGSLLLTDARFDYPEPGPRDPASLDLPVSPAHFTAEDGIALEGWWTPPAQPDRPVIVFVHGLNRSRIEMLERAAEAHRRGYGALLFDLRNHGESQQAPTTLGIHESLDVCSASRWVKDHQEDARVALWGVSLGASTALLAAERCGGIGAVVADSSFLSFEETVSHHFRLIFRLPSFPIANLLTWFTRWRLNLDLGQGDVERAVAGLTQTPVLFIAGSADRRMPPELAQRLFQAAAHPGRELFVVEGATHGEAFRQDPEGYLDHVFGFLRRWLP